MSKHKTVNQILRQHDGDKFINRLNEAFKREVGPKTMDELQQQGYRIPLPWRESGVYGIVYGTRARLNEVIGDSQLLKRLSAQIDCPVFVALYGSKPDDDTKVYDSSFNLVKTIKKG